MKQTYIIIGLLILIINLLSGKLLADNFEHSKLPIHKLPILKSTATSYMDYYDLLSYDIDLKVKHFGVDGIKGTVGFEAQIVENNISRIEINLADNMIVDSIYNESDTFEFDHSNDLITITLKRTYNSGESIKLTTAYRGWPEPCGLQGFNIMKHDIKTRGQLVISTLSEPECARSWWPCKDQANDKANRYDIAIEVDKQFYCVSNGSLDSTIASGDTTHTFYYTEKYPMATYNFAMAISDYAIWDDFWPYNNDQDTMPIYHYVFRALDDTYRETKWGITPDVLTLLSDWFGQYPFADEKYGHANYQAPYGMEHQTISFMPGYNVVFDSAKYLVHEMAHQWWGNMITCESWNHVWIQEGLATYSEALYYENTGEWEKYHQHMNGIRCEKTNRSVYVEDETDIDEIFDEEFTYYKAAWVMHMLRRKLGDDLFRDCLHALSDSESKYGSAKTDDVKNIFEDTTSMDLDKFFDQWIYGVGLPNYEWSYWQGPANTNENSSARNIYLYVEQVQETNPKVFEMPVDFVFEYKNGQIDTVTLEINDRINRHVIKVSDVIDTVKLDPMNWVLQKNENIDWRMRIVTEYVPGIPEIALDTGVVGTEYEDTIFTSNEVNDRPMFYRTDGNLPPGWTLNSDGVIHGLCLDVGSYDFTVVAVYGNISDTLSLSLTILPLPENYSLYQNYPNPFNNGTIIVFDLPKPGNTTIEIFNVLGQRIKTLIDGFYFAGNQYHVVWQGKNDLGKNVSSGIYLYRLRSGDYTSTRKMLLLK